MASSSRSHQTLKNSNSTMEHKQEKVLEVGQEEEKGKDEWLKLGLGLGISDNTPCNKNIGNHGSNPVLHSPSSQGLIISQYHHDGLGLRLGFEEGSVLGSKGINNEGLGSIVKPSTVAYHHNSLLGWSSSSDQCNYYHHNDDGNGMKLWPSCQIDSQGLPTSVPCNESHHYCDRSISDDPHQSGLWFTLRSSTNRSGEALPQIPKAYIRVRDENMTVFMVKTYLVRKLGLSNEAEMRLGGSRVADYPIGLMGRVQVQRTLWLWGGVVFHSGNDLQCIEISCMGESLSHIQTLKQVRDAVWLPRLVESLNSTTFSIGDSHDMSINHIMSLLYRKHCLLN